MSLADMYTRHHTSSRSEGFSILKEERGKKIRAYIGSGKTVLDLGCRNGALTKFFTEGNTITGVDIDPVALEAAKKNLGIETFQLDLHGEWGALHGRLFDVVFAGEVLEHLYFPGKIVEEAARHVSQGGLFLGSVPNAFSIVNRIRYLMGHKKNTPLGDPTHITQFHIRELQAILENYFDEVEIQGLSRFQHLADISPALFGFDLFFIARKK